MPEADVVADPRQELEALLQFLYLAPVGLVQTRLDGEVTLINPRCAQWLLPLAPDGDLQNLFDALAPLAPDLRQRVQAFAPQSGKVCEGLQLPVRAGRAGGQPAQVLSLTLIRLDAGTLMAVLDDITEQLRRERALRHSQAWLHGFVQGAQDYAWLSLDGAGRITAWNASIGRLAGWRGEPLVGQPFTVLLPADASPLRLEDALAEADGSGWLIDDTWLLRADGGRLWGSLLVAPAHPPGERDPARRGYSLVVRDMSEGREALESLRRSVSCDHLTGLANRRALFDTAAAEIQRCQRQSLPLSLLILDADHFKAINDRHGHAAGDAVLRHVAAVLSAAFRDVDLVARHGGEEFVVLMPGTDARSAEAAALRACEQLRSHPARVGTLEVPCTLSAGLAPLLPGDDLDRLLQRADVALYAAKAAGRDRVVAWQPGAAEPSTA